jgi:hypothetical protein
VNNLLPDLLLNLLCEAYLLSVQDPVRINGFSEPEPDVAILRHREDYYAESPPGPQGMYC